MSAKRRKQKGQIELSIGKHIRIGQTQMVIGAAVLAGLIIAVILYNVMIVKPRREEEAMRLAAEEEAKYTLTALNEGQLQGGMFYIKTGNDFYPVNRGKLFSFKANDQRIAASEDPQNRMVLLKEDDSLTPTMYEDSSLIYKAVDGETIPKTFTMERFKDEGWTIGIIGLSDSAENGKYRTIVSGSTFYPGSSISGLQVNAGDDLLIDKIGGTMLESSMITDVGSIRNLQKDSYYQVDAYDGTDYIGMEAAADTHILTSYELFKVGYYDMDQTGYMELKFPLQLQSGYYYIQGVGLFKFIHGQSGDGSEECDWNVPYYLGKASDGSRITNPVQGFDDEGTLEGSKTDYSWKYTVDVTTSEEPLAIGITYTNAAGLTTEEAGIPAAFVEAPDGKTVRFDSKVFAEDEIASTGTDTYDEGILSVFIAKPVAGTWTVHMSGMNKRQYNIETGTSPVNTDGTVTNKLVMRVAKDLADGTFHFTWENTNKAAVFEMVSPTGKTYSTSKDSALVEVQTYGMLDFHVGEAEAGDWQVTVRGGDLGKVYYTYTDNNFDTITPEGTEEEKDSNETDTSSKDTSAASSSAQNGSGATATTGHTSSRNNVSGSTGSSSGQIPQQLNGDGNYDYRFIPKLDPEGVTPRGGFSIDGSIFDVAPADHSINWTIGK